MTRTESSLSLPLAGDIMVTLLIILGLLVVFLMVVSDSNDRPATLFAAAVACMIGLNLSVGLYKLSGTGGKSWDSIAYDAKKECEADLPRNQECIVTVVASKPQPE